MPSTETTKSRINGEPPVHGSTDAPGPTNSNDATNLNDAVVKPGGISTKQMALLEGRLLAANFGNLVTVLMQSPHHAHISLSELRKRIVPPLIKNQFRVAEARKDGSGTTIPVGLILWARVSDDVHKRLLEQPDSQILLEETEWDNGDHYWLVDAVGPNRFVSVLLTGLKASVFAGKTVHYRQKTDDGPRINTFTGTGPDSTANTAAQA